MSKQFKCLVNSCELQRFTSLQLSVLQAMTRLSEKWSTSEKPSIGTRIRGAFKQTPPLRPSLKSAEEAIRVQVGRLDIIIDRLRDKDSKLFNHVVSNVRSQNLERASVFANELVELRKMSKMVVQAKIALESIALRVGTIQDLGDIMVTLAPAVVAIKTVQLVVASAAPEAERSFSELADMLSGVLVDAGRLGGYTVNFETANEDANRILDEASVVAEKNLKDKFPELPVAVAKSRKAWELEPA